MNKKLKRGALALGTLGTIVAPVAAVVSCGTTANTINWDENQTFGGVKGSDFLTEIKHLGKTKQNAITVGREQMMQLQYESESIRSMTAQLADFRYQNWQTQMENAQTGYDYEQTVQDQNDYTGTDVTTIKGFETKLDGLESSIKSNEEKIEKVKGFITKLSSTLSGLDLSADFITDKGDVVTEFYKETYNSSDFPEIYKPLSEIKEEKTAVVTDAYKSFYPDFTTRKEGDKEWPKELAANYGGAATFDQAIDYLVTQEISGKSLNSYKFEINKSFTVEQKIWAKFIDTNNSYKFLIKDAANGIEGSQSNPEYAKDINSIATAKDPVKTIEENILKIKRGDTIDDENGELETNPDGTNVEITNPDGTTSTIPKQVTIKTSILSSSELFLGSLSPDHRMPIDALSELKQVVKYQHLLIKATQGKSPEETWTITGEDLKKLMEYIRYQIPGTKTVETKQGSTLLSSKLLFNDNHETDSSLDAEEDNKFTDVILNAISGNSGGTLNVQGSLGIKSEIEYLKAMVPGFSLGALAITGDGSATPSINEINLGDLVSKLKAALDIEIKKIYSGYTPSATVSPDKVDEVNNEIDATITTLGDDKVKAIFGKVFQDFFKDKHDLVYKVEGSENPITKDCNYLVISQFGIHIIKRSQYDPSTKPTISDALEEDMKNMAKDPELTSSTSIVAELNSAFTETKIMGILVGDKANPLDNDYTKALNKKLEDYNKDKTAEVDKVKIDDIRAVITSVNTLKAQTDVDSAIGDKLENWLVTQIDEGLREIGTTTLTDIYGWVINHSGEGTI